MEFRPLSRRLAAGIAVIGLIAGACSSDDDEPAGSGGDGGGDAVVGGEFVDLGTFAFAPPNHLDPALNNELDAYQVINALYDGLTDIDAADPDEPVVKPHVAETVEANDDATVWTFTIRDGMAFSDGEAILPSTFQASWERATHPDLQGPYSRLFGLIEGGGAKLDGDAETISGVVADDEAMTLTVTLSAPYSNFDAVAGFQVFFPVPAAALDDPEWETKAMIGNGPYALESAPSDTEIVLVKNDSWTGDVNGETWDDRLDRIVFLVSSDVDASYGSFEAEEGHNARIPNGRFADAIATHGTTADVALLSSHYYSIDGRKPEIGGDENLDLRLAVLRGIDRGEINQAIYEGTRPDATGITPPGIPGFKAGLCEACSFDLDAAKGHLQDWLDAGNTQDTPLRIQYPAGSGLGDEVAIMVDNLATVGIDAEGEALDGETYFDQLAEGACVICLSGWVADYPTYDNFMNELFHTDTLDFNNFGFVNEEFDTLTDEAKSTPDKARQAELFNQAEELLLDGQAMALPLNWSTGDYAFDQARVASFTQTNFGLVLWEQVRLAS